MFYIADVKEVFDLFDFWDGRDGLVDGAKLADFLYACGMNPTLAIVKANGGTEKLGWYFELRMRAPLLDAHHHHHHFLTTTTTTYRRVLNLNLTCAPVRLLSDSHFISSNFKYFLLPVAVVPSTLSFSLSLSSY